MKKTLITTAVLLFLGVGICLAQKAKPSTSNNPPISVRNSSTTSSATPSATTPASTTSVPTPPSTPQASAAVPLTETEKTAADLAQTKLLLLQAQAQQLQQQTQTTMQSYQTQYIEQQANLTKVIEAARKAHNLPDSAVFNSTTFSFTLPPSTPPVKSADTPAK